MPDNLPVVEPSFFALPDHAVVVLEGPDAAAFAHAQFANDVVALMPGNWQWNAWLTPKGRVIALFALIKSAEDRILLLVPDADSSELATQLQRFVFRRKLKISATGDLRASGALRKPNRALGAQIAERDGSIELDYSDERQARAVRLGAPQHALSAEDQRARWMECDLQAGLPRLAPAQRELWTPQQLSLEHLRAFSVKKGCYPGQEIVARTHFLGKAKRGLVLFEAGTGLSAGSEIHDGQRVIGNIVSASDGERHLALGVLPLERDAVALNADGVELREIQMVDGMQR